jgi:excinuclease ABC subunit A
MADHKFISIRGAREHNLKNVDLDLPRDSAVVMTGLSGSGKSSLAFDTIYAEGQRRYVESLSAYARQFLEMMQKPDVDQIDGLSPAISIEQKTTSRNPRSTVGTVTEIYDYMRLLFARVGVPYSPATGLPIESQTVSQMVDRVLALPEGTRLFLSRRSCAAARASTARNSPSCRRRASSASRSTAPSTRSPTCRRSTRNTSTTSTSWSTASSCARPGARLADSLETALKLADGLAVAEFADRPLPPEETAEESAYKSRTRRTSASCSRKSSPARSPASPFPRSSRGCSPSTTRSAPARPATAWAASAPSTRPDRARREPVAARRRRRPWAKSTSPYYAQTLEALGKVYGFKLGDRFSRPVGRRRKNAILRGTGERESPSV